MPAGRKRGATELVLGSRKQRRLAALARFHHRTAGRERRQAASLDRPLVRFGPIGCPGTVARMPADTPPERFWRECVAARQPAILEGHLPGGGWHKWSGEYLRRKAGHTTVQVERRPFGSGRPRVPVRFSQLLTAVEAGQSDLYLTTQPIPEGPDGCPTALHAAPVSELKKDFPGRPELLGRLVPSQYNLWLGCSQEGASSGLHHDFHDNLYVLIRGRKKFRLYPPAEAANLYPEGPVHEVHSNGLISYHPDTRSDGVPTENGQPVVNGCSSSVREAEEEDEEEQIERMLEQMLSQPEGGRPDNFCRAQPSRMSKQKLASKFPLFSRAKCVECELEPGQMLYLPASWFHEVTSCSGPGGGGHMAFNYWMHPPGTGCFERPYVDQYWESWYEKLAGQQAS